MILSDTRTNTGCLTSITPEVNVNLLYIVLFQPLCQTRKTVMSFQYLGQTRKDDHSVSILWSNQKDDYVVPISWSNQQDDHFHTRGTIMLFGRCKLSENLRNYNSDLESNRHSSTLYQLLISSPCYILATVGVVLSLFLHTGSSFSCWQRHVLKKTLK